MQTQSVAQTADNVEEERQTDTARQEVQQISAAESVDRRRSNDRVLRSEGESFIAMIPGTVIGLLVQKEEFMVGKTEAFKLQHYLTVIHV